MQYPRIADVTHYLPVMTANGRDEIPFNFYYQGMKHTNSVNYLSRLVNGFIPNIKELLVF